MAIRYYLFVFRWIYLALEWKDGIYIRDSFYYYQLIGASTSKILLGFMVQGSIVALNMSHDYDSIGLAIIKGKAR